MIVSVVKDLASRHSTDEINRAIEAFERTRENLLGAAGADEGEKLSNLLAALEVRSRVEKGMTMNDALREFSQRVRSIVAKPRG